MAQSKASVHPQVIQVSRRQVKNPLLKHIVNVRWQVVKDLVPDYVMGTTTCALYLSLRYHVLHPNYLHQRIQALGKMYTLRVLIAHVDTNDSARPLQVRGTAQQYLLLLYIKLFVRPATHPKACFHRR